MTEHLTTEEFEDLLSAPAAAKVEHHLSTCSDCADELVSMRLLFGSLRDSATAVAAEQQGLARLPAPTQSGFRLPRLAWTFAAAALFVVVSAPIAMHFRPAPAHVRAPAGMMPVETAQATPMSDEALLNSVQNDLSSSVPEPLLPLASVSTAATSGVKTGTSEMRTN